MLHILHGFQTAAVHTVFITDSYIIYKYLFPRLVDKKFRRIFFSAFKRIQYPVHDRQNFSGMAVLYFPAYHAGAPAEHTDRRIGIKLHNIVFINKCQVNGKMAVNQIDLRKSELPYGHIHLRIRARPHMILAEKRAEVLHKGRFSSGRPLCFFRRQESFRRLHVGKAHFLLADAHFPEFLFRQKLHGCRVQNLGLLENNILYLLNHFGLHFQERLFFIHIQISCAAEDCFFHMIIKRPHDECRAVKPFLFQIREKLVMFPCNMLYVFFQPVIDLQPAVFDKFPRQKLFHFCYRAEDDLIFLHE